MGEAWAGHVSAKWPPIFSWKVVDFPLDANFGLVPPIGSKKIFHLFWNVYLNDGMGHPVLDNL